jgi:hypothetical protein
MLESGDINDNAILSNTTQRTDARGLIQFRVNLPSGRLLCSEWIAPDNKKVALRKWVEVVRAETVEDANAARRVKAKPSTPAQTGAAPASVSGTPSIATAPAATTLPAASDPLEMAQSMFERLDKEVSELVALREDVNARLHKASTERDRWVRVINVLKETT